VSWVHRRTDRKTESSDKALYYGKKANEINSMN
jgi:hypothetical protein